MGIFNDFFGGSKKNIKKTETVFKYREFDKHGRLDMKKRLLHLNLQDRKKIRAMFEKYGSLKNFKKISNRQIMKMMQKEFGSGPAARRFRARMKKKVLSDKKMIKVGLTEEQKKAHALSFRYERVAEELKKKQHGPRFAKSPTIGTSATSQSKTSPTANPAGIRKNNVADRGPAPELKDNPRLGL